jgi:hypothetical protein
MTAELAAIQVALDTQLALLDFDISRISFSNTVYVPEGDVPYLDAAIVAVNRRAISIGETGVTQWDGIYQVRCNYPIGVGVADLFAEVKAVTDLFPRGLGLPTSDGYLIRFESPTPKPPVYSGAWASGIAQMPWFLLEVTA